MKKLLVSNRSEIACRIFQACREMGIQTIGVFAPGDEEARHVTYADEVYPIDSYLNVSTLVDVAKKAGADLIHPGYGFLSERPAFASAVQKAGLVFIGPKAETMELMGGKIVAKEIAEKAGVPTLPWAKVGHGGDLKSAAQRVGFPLLLKAAAGGGGKGMRKVFKAEDLEEAAESASREALAAFGDGTLFLERLLQKPRHIEVQVFGDGMGHAVHLHERECSLQRRHQKVWEEATAPHLFQKTREGLFESAIKLSQSVNYRSAGTLEFLVDEDGSFYFLEMNTRLQVEHPVTELVTGLDLVISQIEQALNPRQTLLKAAPAVRGHAIEVRIYAEDPSQGFMPTPGRVDRLKWPTGTGIRVESGIEESQNVGTQFDSMLAKLIVFGSDRSHALARMKFALDETVILGMGTNQNYLRTLCDDPAVREGKVDTHFLEREYEKFAPVPGNDILELIQQARQLGLGRNQQLGAPSSDRKTGKLISPWQAIGAGS